MPVPTPMLMLTPTLMLTTAVKIRTKKFKIRAVIIIYARRPTLHIDTTRRLRAHNHSTHWSPWALPDKAFIVYNTFGAVITIGKECGQLLLPCPGISLAVFLPKRNNPLHVNTIANQPHSLHKYKYVRDAVPTSQFVRHHLMFVEHNN
jgi:hypothetical protein